MGVIQICAKIPICSKTRIFLHFQAIKSIGALRRLDGFQGWSTWGALGPVVVLTASGEGKLFNDRSRSRAWTSFLGVGQDGWAIYSLVGQHEVSIGLDIITTIITVNK
jgi:hypothetical protein